MKKLFLFFACLMGLAPFAVAQYDTIPSVNGRMEGYYYPFWFDTCNIFFDSVHGHPYGDICLDCESNFYWMWTSPNHNDDLHAYMIPVNRPVAIKGFSAWLLDREVCSSTDSDRVTWYINGPVARQPEYLNIYHYDTLNSTLILIDTLRWDTAQAKILMISKNADTARYGFYKIKNYEVILDTPLIFNYNELYVGGTQNNNPSDPFVIKKSPSCYAQLSRIGHYQETCLGRTQSYLWLTDDLWLGDRSGNGWGPFFAMIDFATVEILSADPLKGSTSPGGQISKLTNFTFSAEPSIGYDFSHWQDGNTDNPRTIAVTQDTTFTAYFMPNGIPYYQVSVQSNDSAAGNVSGGGLFYIADSTVIAATPNNHYYFSHWSDGDTLNPRTIIVTQDSAITAIFYPDPYYEIVGLSNNDDWGHVIGSGTYQKNEVALLSAVAAPGCAFLRWSDSAYVPNRRIIATNDTTVTAIFINENSIQQPNGPSFKLSPNPANDQVTVTCHQWHNAEITFIDLTGRQLIRKPASGSKTRISTCNLPKGEYFVVVSNAEGSSVSKLVLQ